MRLYIRIIDESALKAQQNRLTVSNADSGIDFLWWNCIATISLLITNSLCLSKAYARETTGVSTLDL